LHSRRDIATHHPSLEGLRALRDAACSDNVIEDGRASDRAAAFLPAVVARNTQNQPGGRAVLATSAATGLAGGVVVQFPLSKAGRA
ncbi:MAG: hypothetical protein ACREFL_14220, partial [Stellaceae bacterium]